MLADITADLNAVNFAPKSEAEEIIQNVRTILTTIKKTVPMDRDFGVSSEMLDLPIAAAQAKMTAEIIDAVNKFEPRASVMLVDYSGKEMDGVLITKVRVSINGIEESS